MRTINFENNFKNAEEILNTFIGFKPVYVGGLLDSLDDTKMHLISDEEKDKFKATRFATDMVLFILKYTMPERYNVFNYPMSNGVLAVDQKDLMRKVMKDMVDTYEYMFDGDSFTAEAKMTKLLEGIKTAINDETVEPFAGMTEERFNSLKELVIKIHEMECYTNTGELYSCLKDRRILNTNKEIDPGMLIFYSLFGENENIWMNFSCEGHTKGRVIDGEMSFILDEGYLMLDYARHFNNKMGDLIEESVKHLLDSNPIFNKYVKELDEEGLKFDYMIHPGVSSKGWDERVSIRFRSKETVESKFLDVVGMKVTKILYCLFEICKEVNKRTK